MPVAPQVEEDIITPHECGPERGPELFAEPIVKIPVLLIKDVIVEAVQFTCPEQHTEQIVNIFVLFCQGGNRGDCAGHTTRTCAGLQESGGADRGFARSAAAGENLESGAVHTTGPHLRTCRRTDQGGNRCSRSHHGCSFKNEMRNRVWIFSCLRP